MTSVHADDTRDRNHHHRRHKQEQEQRLNQARMRLLDAAADLKPLPSPGELEARLQAAVSEIAAIKHELELLIHVEMLEESGLEAELVKLDEALASGWKPEAEPVSEVVDRFKERYGVA